MAKRNLLSLALAVFLASCSRTEPATIDAGVVSGGGSAQGGGIGQGAGGGVSQGGGSATGGGGGGGGSLTGGGDGQGGGISGQGGGMAIDAGVLMTSVVLSSTVDSADAPFTLGHAFRQGQVPTGTTVTADISPFQCVIKNRWPDGSAKFAILSGRSAIGPQPLRINLSAIPVAPSGASLSTGDLVSSGVTASIAFGAVGTATWAGGDWLSPTQTLTEGPVMSSFVYRKPLGTDRHAVAWLEVRLYAGGEVEVLPWVENGYLLMSAPGSKTGTVTFTLGGTERFSGPLTLLNHQRAVLASGASLTHWYGRENPAVVFSHDTEYLMSTRLVPHYRAHVAVGSPLWARLTQNYQPLAQGNFPTDMGATGYHADIGLLPEWDVAYLTSEGDKRALAAILVHGAAAGRYGTHYRDETTQRPLKFSSYPNLVMSESSGVAFIGASSTNTYTPDATGASPPTYDSPHHPSMGYMAYLVSGWNYFLEETQLLATANFLKNTDTQRKYTQGVFESSVGANITRGAAWAIRTLAQATAITPDGDALRAEFLASLTSNISHYHARYVAQPNNPLGLVEPYDHYEPTDPWQAAPWMDDFFTGTIGFIQDLQLLQGVTAAKLDAFAAWKYQSIVGRLGGSGVDQFSYRYAAQYTVPYAKTNSANWDTGTGPWYANWGEVARAMNLPTAGNLGEPLESGYPETGTAYWGNLMPAISYAVDHGAPGAIEGWYRVTSASNFGVQAADYNDNPVWSVSPRSP